MSRLHVGCCISAHGFGHAARTMAVMEALSSLVELELTVVTQVPEWFLRGSYSGPLSFYPLQTDVGLVQQTPLEQDIPATISELAAFYPVRPRVVESLASIFSGCRLVVCDISPAGIVGARKAGVASVLLENFTWDWIYEEYLPFFPELGSFISYLRHVAGQADYRVQTIPVCDPVAADLVVRPVARAVRQNRAQVRKRLQMGDDARMVLVSMGGIGMRQLPLDRLQATRDTVFVISGYLGEKVSAPNLKFLSPDSDLYHPDLVAASDAVIGKVGYSTLAEVYHADVPFGYISRHDFRESGPLVSFIREEMSGLEINSLDFRQGQWVDTLPQLFSLGKKRNPRPNGAIQCAQFLLSLSDQ